MQAREEPESAQKYSTLPAGTAALVAELLATMSHELRTPLASIKAYTATLLHPRRRISRAERRAFLLTIEQTSDHLEDVIDRLLEMASLETGTLTLEPSRVNLTQFIREAISAVKHRLAAEQATTARRLRFHFEDTQSATDDEALIEADPHLLRQVLDQLLENAITFSPEGGTIGVVLRTVSPPARAKHERSDLPPQAGVGPGRRTVSTFLGLQEEQGWVEFSVRDEGRGMAAEHLARVFDPFYRIDTRLAREVNGLGLGLTICKRIIELHGGAIWAESTVGAGSMFHVRLPRGGPRAALTKLRKEGWHAGEEDHHPGGR
jgi:signal transduction histidine kinase